MVNRQTRGCKSGRRGRPSTLHRKLHVRRHCQCDVGNGRDALNLSYGCGIKVPLLAPVTKLKSFAVMTTRDNDDKRTEHVLTAGGVFVRFEERSRTFGCNCKFSQFFKRASLNTFTIEPNLYPA